MQPVTIETLGTCTKIDLLEIILKKHAHIKSLEAENRQLRDKITKLEEEMTDLKEQIAKLSKNSATSSKPPSSDIVKPPKPKFSGTRKPGAQKGHPGFWHNLFKAEEVDEIKEYRLSECPDCKIPLSQEHPSEPWIQHTVEIPEKLTHVTEHRRLGYVCPQCQKSVYAPLPDGLQQGNLFGPRLQSLSGYLKGALHGSYTTLQEFMVEVFKLNVSRAMLCNQVRSISESLSPPYQELEKAIADQPYLHIDETGYKDKGDRYWIWAFCAKLFGFFTVEASRGSQVLKKVLGETFKGTLISDFFSAYTKYASALQQFRLAHLIRDIKFLTTLPDIANQQFGIRLLRQFKRLLYFWHLRHTMPEKQYSRAISVIQRNLRALVSEKQLPRKSQTIVNRLDKHWSSYLCFLVDPLIAPTNNLAEQTIRTVVTVKQCCSAALTARSLSEAVL